MEGLHGSFAPCQLAWTPKHMASLCWASALVSVKWAGEVLFLSDTAEEMIGVLWAGLCFIRDREVATTTRVPAPGCEKFLCVLIMGHDLFLVTGEGRG